MTDSNNSNVPPRPLLFQTKEGIEWMLRAVEKADKISEKYEQRIGDVKKKRMERYTDFMDFCHMVMDEARRDAKSKSKNKING